LSAGEKVHTSYVDRVALGEYATRDVVKAELPISSPIVGKDIEESVWAYECGGEWKLVQPVVSKWSQGWRVA
jgi:hypothetical protein